jgi:hypothetical protein
MPDPWGLVVSDANGKRASNTLFGRHPAKSGPVYAQTASV